MKWRRWGFTILSVCVLGIFTVPTLADVPEKSGVPAEWISRLSLDSAPRLFYTPSAEGRQPFADLMNEAQVSIKLYMYRMTDNYLISALKKAAARGVKVRVLLDPVKLKEASMQTKMKTMQAAGIEVRGGSAEFSMTHAKSMVIDARKAIVSTMNLTWTFKDNRGYGLVLNDASVIEEIDRVFDADWERAGGLMIAATTIGDPNLIWTPGNSEAKLIDLARAARTSIEIVVENLGATPFLDELINAKKRGVLVRVLVPLCTTSSNPLHNTYFAGRLAAAGIEIRNVPLPHSETQPYSHAKLMAVDGRYVYLGSQNFSKNSLQKSRELGLITDDPALYQEVIRVWNADWSIAVAPPAKTDESTCPVNHWGPKPAGLFVEMQ